MSERKPQLCLHSGAEQVTVERLKEVVLPPRTASWVPVPHHTVYGLAKESLVEVGYRVESEQHALSKDGARYFGILGLSHPGHRVGGGEWGMVIGIRNSHDMSFPAALALGQRVFVCDNLAFNAEVKLSRKHTTYIMRDLPGLTHRAVAMLTNQHGKIEQRTTAYKAHRLELKDADHLLVGACMASIIPNAMIGDVAREYRRPSYPDFEQRTLWSFFNAFTYVMRERGGAEVPRRTMALTGMFDGVVGLN